MLEQYCLLMCSYIAYMRRKEQLRALRWAQKGRQGGDENKKGMLTFGIGQQVEPQHSPCQFGKVSIRPSYTTRNTIVRPSLQTHQHACPLICAWLMDHCPPMGYGSCSMMDDAARKSSSSSLTSSSITN